MIMKMTFVIGVFGSRYAGMLATLVHSISATHQDSQIYVFFQDIPEPLRDAISVAYPAVRFVPTDFDFHSDPLQRISSKLLIWDYAARYLPDGSPTVFLDVDTLVVRQVRPVFADGDWDIGFTTKPESIPLNSGVILCRISDRSRAFFQRWLQETQAILKSADLMAVANNYALPYGGADQMSLYRLISFTASSTRFSTVCGGERVTFQAFPCEELNETRCRPLNATMRVIHFKGGWQPILLQGVPFTRMRPKASCKAMYILYLDTHRAAIDSLVKAGASTLAVAQLRYAIKHPAYTQTSNRLWSVVLYGVLSVRFLPIRSFTILKIAVGRAKRFLSMRKRPPN